MVCDGEGTREQGGDEGMSGYGHVVISTRKCADCKKVKPLSEFSLRNREKGYFSSYCKPCNSARTVDYNRRNQERVRANAKKFFAANPEKVKEYNKRGGARWRARNPDYYRARHAANREIRNQKSRDYHARNQNRAQRNTERWRLLNREAAADKMLQRIRQMLPSGLPAYVKSEVVQSLMLEVLTGELTLDTIKAAIPTHVRRAWDFDMRLVSLDAPLLDGESTLADVLDDKPRLPRKLNKRGRPRKQVDMNAVAELRRQGLTWMKVAQVLGVHRNTLRRTSAIG